MKNSGKKILLLVVLLCLGSLSLLIGAKSGTDFPYYCLRNGDFSDDPYSLWWTTWGSTEEFEWNSTNEYAYYMEFTTEDEEQTSSSESLYEYYSLLQEFYMPELDEYDYEFDYITSFDYNSEHEWTVWIRGIMWEIHEYSSSEFGEQTPPIPLGINFSFSGAEPSEVEECGFKVLVTGLSAESSAIDVAFGYTDNHVAKIDILTEAPRNK